jgi:hypothetical protein
MTDIEKTTDEAWRQSCFEAAMSAHLRFDESWERLPGETGAAYAAFRAYRDYGPERNIRKAVEVTEKDSAKWEKRYRMFSDAA